MKIRYDRLIFWVSYFCLFVFLCCILASCKNLAYNKVNNDTEISARNKKILIGVCDKQFPQEQGRHTSDTVVKITIDTVANENLLQTITNLQEFISSYDCNVDTGAITEIIRAGLKPTYIYSTIKTTIRDTVFTANQYQLTACNDEKRALEKDNDKLSNANEVLTGERKTIRRRGLFGWIAFGVLTLLIGLRFYFKRKI